MSKFLFYISSVVFLCGLPLASSNAALSENSKAHLLAGSSVGAQDPEAAVIEASPSWRAAAAQRSAMTYWNSEILHYPGVAQTPNLVSPSHLRAIREFSRSSLSDAYANTSRVLYPFSGPDFAFPTMFFPHMTSLVLIGLENVGELPDVESMSRANQLPSVMKDIADAYVYLPERSYFVTRRMAVMLKKFGVSTMLAVGLAAANNEIYDVKKVSLDRTGALVPDTGNGPHGVVIWYTKPDGQMASVTYFRQDLSNSGLAQLPEFELFLRKTGFDTAFYKAAQGLSFGPNFSKINEIVTESVRYVVESDDGIPLKVFTSAPQKWRTQIFGLYARPNSQVLGDRFQADLLQEDAIGVCASNNQPMIIAFERIWSSRDICTRYQGRSHAAGVSWNGFIPFPFGYGYRLTPVPEDLHAVTSNIIYAERLR